MRLPPSDADFFTFPPPFDHGGNKDKNFFFPRHIEFPLSALNLPAFSCRNYIVGTRRCQEIPGKFRGGNSGDTNSNSFPTKLND
jgi:hypothetical protein